MCDWHEQLRSVSDCRQWYHYRCRTESPSSGSGEFCADTNRSLRHRPASNLGVHWLIDCCEIPTSQLSRIREIPVGHWPAVPTTAREAPLRRGFVFLGNESRSRS